MADNTSFKCVPCNAAVSNPTSWIMHVLSKAHKKKVYKQHPNEIESRRFIFVTGPNVQPADMVFYFLRYGLVTDVDKVSPRGKSPFYFVEFASENGARSAMAEPSQVIKGQPASVYPRKAVVSESNTIDTTVLIEGLMTNELPSGQVDALIKVVEMTPRELNARQRFRNDLERWLRRNIRDGATVHIFGSCLTGLGLRGTDIDFYVDFGFKPGEEEMSQPQQVKTCAVALRQLPGITTVQPVTKARVPIVKFFSRDIGVHVDLSFRNAMSIRNSELIRSYIRANPWLRRVLMALRWWAKTHGITVSGRQAGFSNYAFSWLVIFALMTSPKDGLPSVAELQNGAPVDEIEGWNCGFRPQPQIYVRDLCILTKMQHFFEFYSNFDFGLYVLCPLVGKAIPKFLFGKPDRLGPEFARYKDLYSEGKCDIMRLNAAACVQDPFELNFNAARSVNHAGVKLFAVKCKEAWEIGRLWFVKNPIAALYPMIHMSVGEEQARRLCAGHYVIPFRPGFANPPPLPYNVISFGVGACSLVHSYGKTDLPSTMEAYRTYWDEAVVKAVRSILTECLFFDVWDVDDIDAELVDYLENFKPEFLEAFRAEVRKHNELIRKQRVFTFTQELQKLATRRQKLEESLRVLVEQENATVNETAKPEESSKSGEEELSSLASLSLSDEGPSVSAVARGDGIAEVMAHVPAAEVPNQQAANKGKNTTIHTVESTRKQIATLLDQELSVQERLEEAKVEVNVDDLSKCELPLDTPSKPRKGKGNVPAEDLRNPLVILGQPVFGPLQKRSARVEWMKEVTKTDVESRLDEKHILATFFCEVRHASLLRKPIGSVRRGKGPCRVSREKYATAKLLYTLKNPPQFEIDDVPSRQFILTVGRSKDSMAGVEIIVGGRPCVACDADKKVYMERVVKALVAYLESVLFGILEEEDGNAFDRDDHESDAENDGVVENGEEPATEAA